VNDGYGYNYAVNNFYRPVSVDTLNQYYTDSLHSYSISPTLSYTEPIGKTRFWNSIITIPISIMYRLIIPMILSIH
jgi:hypothetical protein